LASTRTNFVGWTHSQATRYQTYLHFGPDRNDPSLDYAAERAPFAAAFLRNGLLWDVCFNWLFSITDTMSDAEAAACCISAPGQYRNHPSVELFHQPLAGARAFLAESSIQHIIRRFREMVAGSPYRQAYRRCDRT